MGSLASRPSVPSIQTIYTPVYSPAPSPAPIATPSGPSEQEQQSARRAASLLERNRGAYGTVLTGFRGLLGQNSGAQRKTLLGE